MDKARIGLGHVRACYARRFQKVGRAIWVRKFPADGPWSRTCDVRILMVSTRKVRVLKPLVDRLVTMLLEDDAAADGLADPDRASSWAAWQ
ncbi:uncharacterized protein UV8b_01881 [Ustilaginoidea virens]|uniref:Uncharacterized protein n=1 Tax=Ustilaginoidea virens TaxID=1159556 RepID=A0A8E5HLV3_USTVR|nr:uncharacterized protein UV8b_01881 [Ustilaginoidea virens]QUC17640.1 hypothetical protein UV8b_01881 [Ustilaginoidea virens]